MPVDCYEQVLAAPTRSNACGEASFLRLGDHADAEGATPAKRLRFFDTDHATPDESNACEEASFLRYGHRIYDRRGVLLGATPAKRLRFFERLTH